MKINNKSENIVVIIQARMSSSRLPGKVLRKVNDREILDWVVTAANKIRGVHQIVVATSVSVEDDAIEEWCLKNNHKCCRGSLDDVLTRFIEVAEQVNATTIMRITADCPILLPEVCELVLELYLNTNCDLATNADTATWPDGLDCEVFTYEALKTVDTEAKKQEEREHVTTYIKDNRDRFSVQSLSCPIPSLGNERLVVDVFEDIEYLNEFVKNINTNELSLNSVLAELKLDRITRQESSSEYRNSAYLGRVPKTAKDAYDNFSRSQTHLKEAKKLIPLGTQTFSKSEQQYPKDKSPHFLSHGFGGRVWDVDGHEYVDLVCGLLPVVLGYCDNDVDTAIKAQLGRAITMSLPTILEAELSEKLTHIIPSAEMVRFGKNGTDVTSAAIRLARSYTARERIIVCGYHGWQDWYIGSTSFNSGIPESTINLTHSLKYNDIEVLEKIFQQYPDEVAAIIMEPMNFFEPSTNYLQQVKNLAHKYGALLIFDEIVTGFRFSLGGAQELFKVTPDLACFGKALGNGMPISAIVGNKNIMSEMDKIFFSGTFSGEALSLAAANAVIDKMINKPVIETIWKTGESLDASISSMFEDFKLLDVFSLQGKPPFKLIQINDHEVASKEAIKTLFMREMLKMGVLVQVTHNICFAHTEADQIVIRNAYDHALGVISSALESGSLEQELDGSIIEPVFKVRQ